jgi:corrinoid protein of di/trimethylamine methyltransferase
MAASDPQEFLKSLTQSIVDGEPADAERLAGEALLQGMDPLEAIHHGFLPGIDEVGRAFGCGEMFLPDLVRAGKAMKAAMKLLEPEMVRRGGTRSSAGVVVIGTVKGDIHEIGKSLVATMLTASGFVVHDLGVDVPTEVFVARARETNADIVGLSSLLTTTMVNQRRVIEALQDAGLRPRVKVLVGGAPVSADWAREIGADGSSGDAFGAVAVAKQVLGQPPPQG